MRAQKTAGVSKKRNARMIVHDPEPLQENTSTRFRSSESAKNSMLFLKRKSSDPQERQLLINGIRSLENRVRKVFDDSEEL